MKKKALYILGSIVVLLGGLLFGGQIWLKGRFEKGALVQQIEAQWNCRAELDSSSVNLFSAPAKVELKGLRLAPRDEETAKLPADRKALDAKAVMVSMERAELVVELWDLLGGKVNVKKLHFETLGVKGEIAHDGKNSLEVIFQSPDKAPRVVKVGPDKEQTVAVTAGDVQANGVHIKENGDKKPDEKPQTPEEAKPEKPKATAKEDKKPEAFKAGNMPVSLQVDEAGIHNGRLEITDHDHGTHTLLEHLRFVLKDMDVNPADLAHHNVCKMEFDGALKLDREDTATSTANFEVNGSGLIKPFDAESGEWNPDLTLDVALKKGSQLGGALMKDSIRKKDIDKLKEYGIDFGDIALGGVLGEDVATEVHMFNGKTIVKQDTRLVFPQYEITLLGKSWFNSSQDVHNVQGVLVVAPDLSARIIDQTKKKIDEKYAQGLGSLAEDVIKKVLLNDKGQLVIPFKSRGSMSKPDINVDNFLGDIVDGFKTLKSGLLNDLLGK